MFSVVCRGRIVSWRLGVTPLGVGGTNYSAALGRVTREPEKWWEVAQSQLRTQEYVQRKVRLIIASSLLRRKLSDCGQIDGLTRGCLRLKRKARRLLDFFQFTEACIIISSQLVYILPQRAFSYSKE